jgi:3-phosphoshikimate 1-carboxyvinyltransferase
MRAPGGSLNRAAPRMTQGASVTFRFLHFAMTDLIIRPSGPLHGSVAVPGDKSITHRAILLSALADGNTRVHGWVPAEVCLATLRCMRALGANIAEEFDPDGAPALAIHGSGLAGLREPGDVLDCAGSGTTIRLLAGLLAGQPFTSILTGSEALRHRPMGRIIEPLRRMGATILGRDAGRLAPLAIRGGGLRGIEYELPIASAQVKSAILLAGLFADGETVLREPGPSRDHTERMLCSFGVVVNTYGLTVRLAGRQRLTSTGAMDLQVPADFSSAAFPLGAALIVPGSEVRIRGVGLNPTRTGLLDLVGAMGAQVTTTRSQLEGSAPVQGEPYGELESRSSRLHATEAAGHLIVRTIDEFPVFAVAASQAEGTTVVRDAAELRVKESDRIATMTYELRKMGAQIDELPDGMVIRGPTRLRGAVVECHRDHRLAMALAVAGLAADGETVVHGAEAIGDSFPNFAETMQALGADVGTSER